jgi:hypothetical protein
MAMNAFINTILMSPDSASPSDTSLGDTGVQLVTPPPPANGGLQDTPVQHMENQRVSPTNDTFNPNNLLDSPTQTAVANTLSNLWRSPTSFHNDPE